MLKKRIVIQKSFRIEKEVDDKISEISSILNYPQNSIVNDALREYLEKHYDEYKKGGETKCKYH